MTSDDSPCGGTVRERLIGAADAEIAASGDNSLQMEAVAHRAGVSRATAYRHLGSISEMLVQVALLRARRHVGAIESIMADRRGALSKLEAALVYTTHELPRDPTSAALIARHPASIRDSRVIDVAVALLGPVLADGIRDHQIRDGLSIRDLSTFLVEQTYLAAAQSDRSEHAVAHRFQNFVAPVLIGSDPSSDCTSVAATHECTALTAIEAVENLRHCDNLAGGVSSAHQA